MEAGNQNPFMATGGDRWPTNIPNKTRTNKKVEKKKKLSEEQCGY